MGVTVTEKPKGSGIYYINICHKGQRASRKAGSKKLADSMARLARKELLADELGIIKEVETPLFGEYAESWLDRFIKPPMCEPGTYDRYSGILTNHVLPALSTYRINEITRGQIRDVFAERYRGGLSRSSLKLMLAVMSGVFNHAMDDDIVKTNPSLGVMRTLNFNKTPKTEIEPFTLEESFAVLDSIEKHIPRYYLFFLTMFRTGLRLGECCALQWPDVNWKEEYIKIQRSSLDQRVKNNTKTNKPRKVDITPGLMEQLEKEYANHKRELLKGKGNSWVFEEQGKLLQHKTIRYNFNRATSKAGINKRRIHDIRHTFASILLSDGIPVIYVSNQLGHSSMSMTLDIYAHYIPSTGKKYVNILDQLAKSAI